MRILRCIHIAQCMSQVGSDKHNAQTLAENASNNSANMTTSFLYNSRFFGALKPLDKSALVCGLRQADRRAAQGRPGCIFQIGSQHTNPSQRANDDVAYSGGCGCGGDGSDCVGLRRRFEGNRVARNENLSRPNQ